jgi:hypothetical protein
MLNPQNSLERKVIFIGGTNYSGSTLLDMVLGNDYSGFSCGELDSLVHPYRPHHLNPVCSCGDTGCNVWHLTKDEKRHLHETIFSRFPDVHFVVDSSKWIPWLTDRQEELKKKGFSVRNILIWKSPAQYFHSCLKRGQTRGWAESWIRYHLLYFSTFDDWVSVSYDDFVSDESILENLCKALDIPYFASKRSYWEKTHHVLFGNSSAKIHLYETDTDQYNVRKSELDRQGRQDNIAETQAVSHREIQSTPEGLSMPKISWKAKNKMDCIIQMLEEAGVDRGIDDQRAASGNKQVFRGYNQLEASSIKLAQLLKRRIATRKLLRNQTQKSN